MSAPNCRRWNQRQRYAWYNSNRRMRTLKTPHRTKHRFGTRFPNPHLESATGSNSYSISTQEQSSGVLRQPRASRRIYEIDLLNDLLKMALTTTRTVIIVKDGHCRPPMQSEQGDPQKGRVEPVFPVCMVKSSQNTDRILSRISNGSDSYATTHPIIGPNHCGPDCRC